MADLVSVIRGKMGGREYYIGKMTFQELAAKVQFFEELDKTPALDELLQRQLSARSEQMVEYLLRQSERFYGAIIVAAWGGRPEFVRVKMEDHPLLDHDFEFGLLKFDGRQEYFALDGQHRLKSIKTAIEKDPGLRHEEVSVIFVTHERTDEGNIKTRRLFHTLNRYARPTTSGENIQLDEDNVVSIATRMLLKSDMAALKPDNLELVRKNLTKKQRQKFTSLAALWDFNMAVLEPMYGFKKASDYLRFRPAANDIDHVYTSIATLWYEMRARTEDFINFENGTSSAGEIREPDGDPARGNILFRPVGLRIYGIVIGNALTEFEEVPVKVDAELKLSIWGKVLDRIRGLTLTAGEAPWRGTIFRNNKIETGGRSLAIRLACYMLNIGQPDADKLLSDYRGHMEDENAELPDRIS